MTAVLIISALFAIVGIIVARLMRWWQPAAMGIALGTLVCGFYFAYTIGAL
jgi:uncharacterized membrane protein